MCDWVMMWWIMWKSKLKGWLWLRDRIVHSIGWAGTVWVVCERQFGAYNAVWMFRRLGECGLYWKALWAVDKTVKALDKYRSFKAQLFIYLFWGRRWSLHCTVHQHIYQHLYVFFLFFTYTYIWYCIWHTPFHYWYCLNMEKIKPFHMSNAVEKIKSVFV